MHGRLACRDLADDRQAQRLVLSGFGHVLGSYRIAIHGRVVESRQVDRRDDVFADIEIHRIQDVLAEKPGAESHN